MKTKKFNKKLALKKNTIANLNNDHMKHVYGGEDTLYGRTCITRCGTNCICPTGETKCEPCSS